MSNKRDMFHHISTQRQWLFLVKFAVFQNDIKHCLLSVWYVFSTKMKTSEKTEIWNRIKKIKANYVQMSKKIDTIKLQVGIFFTCISLSTTLEIKNKRRSKPSLEYSLEGFSTNGLIKLLRLFIVNTTTFSGYSSM